MPTCNKGNGRLHQAFAVNNFFEPYFTHRQREEVRRVCESVSAAEPLFFVSGIEFQGVFSTPLPEISTETLQNINRKLISQAVNRSAKVTNQC